MLASAAILVTVVRGNPGPERKEADEQKSNEEKGDF